MKRKLTILLFALLSTVTLFSQSDFSQWRGPNRDGHYPESNLLSTWGSGAPPLLWKFNDLGAGYASASVADGHVVTVGTSPDSVAHVYCFDLKGALQWKTKLGRDFMGEYSGTYSTPVLCKGRGYITTGLGVLYCFSLESGSIIWSQDLIKTFNGPEPKSGYLDNLVIHENLVICAPGGSSNNIVALDQLTGKLVWQSGGQSEVGGFGSPALISFNGQKLYVYQDATSIIALNPADGKVVWKYERGCGTAVGTLFHRDGFLFYLAEGSSVMLKLSSDGRPPQIAWTSTDFFPLQGDPVLIGNRLYGKGRGKKFVGIDWKTGQTIVSIPTQSMVVTSITADGKIYYYDIDGSFQLIQPTDSGLETVGSFKVHGGTKYHCSHPVISGGVLYIRHDNSLFAYKISK